MQIKDIVKKYWWILVVIILVPIVIDKAYFWYEGEPNTTLSSSDILGYWGIVVSGIVVLGGVFITIRYTNKQNEGNRIKQIYPKLSSKLIPIEDTSFLERDSEYEYISIMINGDGITGKVGDSFLYNYHKHYTRKFDGFPGRVFLDENQQKVDLCFHYIIYNGGSETACNLDFKINGNQYLPPFSIPSNNSKLIKLLVSVPINFEGEKKVSLVNKFSNIDNTKKYIAEESFTLFKNEKGFLTYRRENEEFMNVRER